MTSRQLSPKEKKIVRGIFPAVPAPVERKRRGKALRTVHTCDNCSRAFTSFDPRAAYCSDDCQRVIANWHKRVAHNFRPYAALGFTLSWQDSKIFLVRLPDHPDFPVPTSFSFSSYYDRGAVEKWNAIVILHNTLFMGKDEDTAALEITCHDLEKEITMHIVTKKPFAFDIKEAFCKCFVHNVGIPIGEPLKQCPDCKKSYLLTGLWWELASNRNTLICRDCAKNDLPF